MPLENLKPLNWEEIARTREPEELPFLRYFVEVETNEAPEQG
jgi:hypothetical protein